MPAETVFREKAHAAYLPAISCSSDTRQLLSKASRRREDCVAVDGGGDYKSILSMQSHLQKLVMKNVADEDITRVPFVATLLVT